MKKVGYPARKAAAVEVAASTDGQLAPPIMGAAAFIIAEYVNVPYIEVVQGRGHTGLCLVRRPLLHHPHRSVQTRAAGHPPG